MMLRYNAHSVFQRQIILLKLIVSFMFLCWLQMILYNLILLCDSYISFCFFLKKYCAISCTMFMKGCLYLIQHCCEETSMKQRTTTKSLQVSADQLDTVWQTTPDLIDSLSTQTPNLHTGSVSTASSDQSDSLWQMTPDSIPSLSDTHTPTLYSGLLSSVVQRLDFKCLDCFLEDPVLHGHQGGGGRCKCASNDYDGFEDYTQDIFVYRREMEAKYHVTACLDNQPEVWKTN